MAKEKDNTLADNEINAVLNLRRKSYFSLFEGYKTTYTFIDHKVIKSSQNKKVKWLSATYETKDGQLVIFMFELGAMYANGKNLVELIRDKARLPLKFDIKSVEVRSTDYGKQVKLKTCLKHYDKLLIKNGRKSFNFSQADSLAKSVLTDEEYADWKKNPWAVDISKEQYHVPEKITLDNVVWSENN